MKVVYQASDGKIFTNAKECVEYDNFEKRVRGTIKKVEEYCSSFEKCDGCPFLTENGNCNFSIAPIFW